MNRKRIYLQAAEQISIQQPLSEQWMQDPVFYNEFFVKAVNPIFRDYIPANEARRMGNIMKRALVTSLQVLHDSGIEHPDAIITGTSIGSLDYTEKFLDAMVDNGEEALSPTFFMQSTHNTVSSTLGIYTKTHGYNTTYSHGNISFDLALQDAWMQMQLNMISTALVGGHDEMVDSYFRLLQKTGYVGVEGMVPCGEVAVSMMLNTNNLSDYLCELAGIHICHCPSLDDMKFRISQILLEAGMAWDDISAVMTGVNGNAVNDHYYECLVDAVFPDKPLLKYKQIFGENYTSSALGVYAAAQCLRSKKVPQFMCDTRRPYQISSLDNILMVNVMEGKEYSLILLRK